MAYMFCKCTSLKSLDISSFDTSRVGDFMQMFASCSELTSLDLTNFNTINAFSFQSTFDSMSKLEYLDISSFYSPYLDGGYFSNHAVSNKTTIIFNKKFRLIYPPNNWKRTFID